jgi:hypothetical protein
VKGVIRNLFELLPFGSVKRRDGHFYMPYPKIIWPFAVYPPPAPVIVATITLQQLAENGVHLSP